MKYKLTADEIACFWPKVAKSDGCWLWTGCTDRKGYGLFRSGGRRAHRISFCLAGEDIPAGMFVLHKCDTPACVNPDHLYLGDHSDNMADRKRRGRVACGEEIASSKLTADQVRAIREEWADLPRAASGYIAHGKLQELADKYQIHKAAVRMIAKRQRWAWLE